MRNRLLVKTSAVFAVLADRKMTSPAAWNERKKLGIYGTNDKVVKAIASCHNHGLSR